MENIFLGFVNRAIAAGWLIAAVIVLRRLLGRAPKWIHCLLWALVAFRLSCPFALESVFSLVPSGETIRRDTAVSDAPVIHTGVRFVDDAVNPVVPGAPAPVEAEAERGQSWLYAAGVLWAVGTAAMLLYALAAYVRLRLRVRTAVRLEGAVMVSEFVDTPFLLGVLRPRIYLPADMPEELRAPVVAHELAHLRRRDNVWKILGYVLLSAYWFQPLCWAAYVLLGRDIELACDEKVIRDYDPGQKKRYSEALLACSMGRRTGLVCPLAFGEVGVRERIRSVLSYRKPAFWAVIGGVAACAAAAVCFLTNPMENGGNSSGTASGNGGGTEKDSGWQGDGSGPEEGIIAGGGSEGIEGPEESAAPDEGEEASPEELADLREELVRQWAEAFVGRDGNAMEELASGSLAEEMLSGPEGQRSFGVSSPWPVEAGRDVRILAVEEGRAQILYYAWTSDPHVSVWKEEISYEIQEGKYVVTDEDLTYLEGISTGEAFGEAYGLCPIDGSAMDYEGNGAGEDLNANAFLSSSLQFRDLFEPETAAVALLNLSGDPAKVSVERLYEESGSVNLEIGFQEDGLSVGVTMVQPYGTNGIWIPKDYRVDPLARFMKMDWGEIRGRNLSVSQEPGGWSEVICIAEIPEADVKLYGYNDAECSGQGVAVEIAGQVSYFDWIYTSPRAILPECRWNEGSEQLQVALRIYTGTGVDAEELHVLQRRGTGALEDNVLDLNECWELLQERIHFTYEEDTGLLTLLDAREQRELASLKVEEESMESLELGNISHFILGEDIVLRVEPGYFPENAAIAEYPEDMPMLEAELLLQESGGKIQFSLGEVRAVPVAD